jgi:hypothetical protein
MAKKKQKSTKVAGFATVEKLHATDGRESIPFSLSFPAGTLPADLEGRFLVLAELCEDGRVRLEIELEKDRATGWWGLRDYGAVRGF